MYDVALADGPNVQVNDADHFLSGSRCAYQLEESGIYDDFFWHARLRSPLLLRRIFSLSRECRHASVAEDPGNEIFRFDGTLRACRSASDLDRVGLGLVARLHPNDLNGQLRDVILGVFRFCHLPPLVLATERILHGEWQYVKLCVCIAVPVNMQKNGGSCVRSLFFMRIKHKKGSGGPRGVLRFGQAASCFFS